MNHNYLNLIRILLFHLLVLSSSLLHAQQWTVYTQTGAGASLNFPYIVISNTIGNRLVVDNTNAIWTNSVGNKITRYSPSSNHWTELIASGANALFSDLERNVYIRQVGGTISRYSGTGFIELFDEAAIISDYVVDSDHAIWYTPFVDGPLVKKYDGTALSEFTLPLIDACCANVAIPIARDNDDVIWSAISDVLSTSKLVQVNGSEIYDNTHSDIFNYLVSSLEVLNNNNIWVGTASLDQPSKGTAFFNRQANTWTMYNHSNSMLPNDSIACLKGDYLNRIWISTHKGLARFDGTNWKLFNTENSPLPSDTTVSIAIDTLGTKWFATKRGLASFNEILPDFNTVSCGMSVTFTDLSESIDGSIVAWSWDFAGLGSSNEIFPTFSFPAPGNYDVKLWIKDDKGNRNLIVKTVAVSHFAETLSLGADMNVCTASVPLASNVTGDGYLWKTPGGTATTNAITADLSGQYTLEVSQGACVQKDTIEIIVNSFTPGSFVMTVAGTELPANGTVLTDVDVSFTNATGTGVNFIWNFGNEQVSSEENPNYTFPEAGQYVVRLTGIDERDCPITVEKIVNVEDLVVTNAISPNGDGKNDQLFIEPFLYNAELKLINRWGQSVYETSSYNNDFTGASLESGVYYYEVYFNEVDKRYKGYVHIMK